MLGKLLNKFSDLNRSYMVLLGAAFSLFVIKCCVSAGVRVEDIQEYSFILVLVMFYYLQDFLRINLSKNIIILVLVFWVFLQARVFIMRELGYYRGKVLISKLEGDSEGYRAREIARGIKVIAKTYHLSGPSLIPYDLKSENIAKWFSVEGRPALIVAGSTSSPVLELPISQFYSKVISDERFNQEKFWLEKDTLNIKLSGYERALSLPLPPSKVSLAGEDSNVIKHYIGWLSGYFHPELSHHSVIRQDTIHETAKISFPWKSYEPRALALYLKSLEELFEAYPHFSKTQADSILVRLDKARWGLDKGDLYCSIQNLRAFIFMTQENSKKALSVWAGIATSRKFTERQRFLAANNLSVVELD